ncbi:MAG: hypothetical protein VKK04_06695 [Synechococcales bacterium]|nr:hypothetical protein [Synechococcales bacterium]
MIFWAALMGLALGFTLLSQRLREEGLMIAAAFAGLVSFIWGFTWAPPLAQLAIALSFGLWVTLRR